MPQWLIKARILYAAVSILENLAIFTGLHLDK
jgi:hypothetical protein